MRMIVCLWSWSFAGCVAVTGTHWHWQDLMDIIQSHLVLGADLKALALTELADVEKKLGHSVKYDMSLLSEDSALLTDAARSTGNNLHGQYY